MGNKDRYTATEVIAAIKDSGGIKAAIAKRLGCHRHTVDNYIERYATVKRAYEAEREGIVDLAEGQFVKKISDGFWPAIRLALLTLGKDRGYVEKQQIEQSGKIEHEHSLSDDERITKLIQLLDGARDRQNQGTGDS